MNLANILNIGNSALSATQTAISTTGNNIANLNTVGYSRQNVRFEDRYALNARPGMLGQGVLAAEIYRNFNQFVENSYLDRFSQQNHWTEQNTIMNTVESVFNESNTDGISSALSDFLNDWNNLDMRPDHEATRISLKANADTLAKTIANAEASLESMQHEMDDYIAQGVDQVNELIEGIRKLNISIASNTFDGQNPNRLLDERDTMVRSLSELIDVDVISRGKDFTVMTKSGHTLVQGEIGYSLEVRGERVENNLVKNSQYTGTMEIDGTSSHEYTFEVVTPPTQGNNGSMRVSIDGGKTWLRDSEGNEMHIDIPQNANEKFYPDEIDVGISFTEDPKKLSVDDHGGDRFEAVPKTGVYWVTPTRDALNITPMVMGDGTDNTLRITGGKLAAYFNVRDQNLGRYREQLDGFSNALVWEVNTRHSQGAGKLFKHTVGSYDVVETGKPLGTSVSGLDYYKRLQTGIIAFQIYDKDGKPLSNADGTLVNGPLDFGSGKPFDPKTHSLNDVTDAINKTYGRYIEAKITDNKLHLTAKDEYSFAVAEDQTGLLAALGINTFFQGSSAHDLAMKNDIVNTTAYINAGKVNANGNIEEGDNSTANSIFNLGLETSTVQIKTPWETSNQTLTGYYSSIVSQVGSDTRTSLFNSEYNTALANDLDEQSSAISGVNLDEEMTNLIKFQHSYTAAAKLITTADQMLQTLLAIKQ